MNLTLLEKKDDFPLHILEKLNRSPIDYHEKHLSIVRSNSTGANHLEAGVVVLLHYDGSEYVFQLIKRSELVTQAGDISCPGGILEKKTDELLNHILLKTGLIRTIDNRILDVLPHQDSQTASLIGLFLMNALREAWEEIGLSPLNIGFLGALPSYSLTFFSRTIFPVVCLVRESYEFKLSSEVEKVVSVPVRYFFQESSYALVEIESGQQSADSHYNMKFPSLVVPDTDGKDEILWGATFNIIMNFLKLVAGDKFPSISPTRSIKKTLSLNYTSGNHD